MGSGQIWCFVATKSEITLISSITASIIGSNIVKRSEPTRLKLFFEPKIGPNFTPLLGVCIKILAGQ